MASEYTPVYCGTPSYEAILVDSPDPDSKTEGALQYIFPGESLSESLNLPSVIGTASGRL